MKRLHRLWLFALVALAAMPLGLQAQRGEGQRVLFRTADGVELIGTFHSGSRRSPAIMMLHSLGDKHNSRAYEDAAETLQKNGYAVLTFDFRGHGQSTTVEPETFWFQGINRALVRGQGNQEISVRDFDQRYYPILANDIAAAKSLLDRKNDVGECNSANLVLIGADDAAALGALWLHGECYRFRQHPPPFFGAPPQIQATSEIDFVLCAVWLNMASAIGGRDVSVASMLALPAQRYRVPMAFLYDRDNAAARRLAQSIERSLKGRERLAYTGAVEVAGNNVERGEYLLNRGNTQRLLEYLKEVKEAKAEEWQEMDPRRTQFVWRTRFALTPANQIGNDTLLFNTYDAFLR